MASIQDIFILSVKKLVYASDEDFVGIKMQSQAGQNREFENLFNGKSLMKSQSAKLLESGLKHLAEEEEKLYAQNQYGVMIILQAMDAAGKDSAIKQIMSGFNPLGVKVHNFKTPTPQELDHHYLWRHTTTLPGRGEIAIHNRSHYENVLVTRVHSEYILKEASGNRFGEQVRKSFWTRRFKRINCFEQIISEDGTIILKFFLHLSKEEQKNRFLERIDKPDKHWKFSFGDLKRENSGRVPTSI